MSSKWARIRDVFVNNWRIKLLALATATISFYAVRLMTRYEVDHDVPVQVVLEEEGIAILDQDPMVAHVLFRGSQEDLLRLEPAQIKIVVPAHAAPSAGPQRLEMRARDVEGVSGVNVVRIDPPFVRVTFDRQIEKTIPVARPTTVGVPLVGTVQVDYEPNVVKVRGPRRALDGVEVAKTELIDVDGQGASFTRRVRVLLPGVAGVSQIDPPEVKVKVNIVTETATRMWTNVTVCAMVRHDLPCRVDFEPPAVNVHLHGRAEVLQGIADRDVKVFVDCMDPGAPGAAALPVRVYLPPGLEVNATVEPRSVRAVIKAAGDAAAGGK